MAYVKTTWQTGDVITAEKLNHVEGGIEDAQGLLVTGAWSEVSGEQWCIFDHTFTEIKAACDNGFMPCFYVPGPGGSSSYYYTPEKIKFDEPKTIVFPDQGMTATDEGGDDVPVIVIS